jgi:hypothetical protein
MKFYRRHKHELHHEEGDEPLPVPPEKKMRYSRGDDLLLARFFASRPEGTSDKVFQAFSRQVRPTPLRKKPCLMIAACSIPTTHGRAGRNITGYTRPRLIILFRG